MLPVGNVIKPHCLEVDMGAMFSSPDVPKQAVVEEETTDDVQDALVKEKEKQKKRRGRASTILTSMTKEGTLLGG